MLRRPAGHADCAIHDVGTCDDICGQIGELHAGRNHELRHLQGSGTSCDAGKRGAIQHTESATSISSEGSSCSSGEPVRAKPEGLNQKDPDNPTNSAWHTKTMGTSVTAIKRISCRRRSFRRTSMMTTANTRMDTPPAPAKMLRRKMENCAQPCNTGVCARTCTSCKAVSA